MTRFEAAFVDQIPAGGMISVSLGSAQVLIANLDGTFYAMNDLCPHLAVPMSQGELQEQCVVCPGHGSVFALATGKVVKWIGKEPGILGRLMNGKSAPADVYPTSVEGGKVYVEI